MTVEALGKQLRDVLPTRRLHSVSLCDHEGNVLWLSEGALGPDEHSLVSEALQLLSADPTLHSHELSVEDGRFALFLPVRAPTADLVGIAMILADTRTVGDDTLERMAAAPVRAIMLRLAVLLKPGDRPAGAMAVPVLELAATAETATPAILSAAPARARPPVISAAQANDILEFNLEDSEAATGSFEAAPPAPAAPASSEADELLILEFSDQPAPAPPPPPAAPAPAARPLAAAPPPPRASAAAAPARPVPPTPPTPPTAAAPVAPKPVPRPAPPAPPPVVSAAPATRQVPLENPAPPLAASTAAGPATQAAHLPVGPGSASDPNLILEVLPYAKLRAGGQTRRLQLLARSSPSQRDPAAYDALILQRLLGWLAAHRAAWTSQPTSFTINLSIATLEDERFAQKIAATLNSHGIAPDTLGFEIAEALCTQRRAQVERFITQCDKIGAWVVIDDFSFDSQVLPLLRSKALRLVKIDSKLTSSALKDKLAQAMVVATVQAAKVLGIHCSAKKVDSQAALQWLTAIGCDFAQGAALSAPQPLDALAGSPDPTGLVAAIRP
jgi:EAL domain-containing protein (putative c-di-GMP-specific phosphodiesterase class I)